MNRRLRDKMARRGSGLRRERRLAVEALERRLCLSLSVPAFSSVPTANHTIYLDFDGHTTTGTYWNNNYGSSFTNLPYNTDADPNNFSASELADIEAAWKRVAEDYAPFNVNVTTVEPPLSDLVKSGTTDPRWGVRAVVSKDTVMGCNCGGIAYIDSFNWNTDTPVFVYTTGGKNIAEAASHEVGHSLGLAHDDVVGGSGYYSGHGSGDTGWAPIMGVGYYKNVTQWDKGEYYNASNGGSGANYSKGPDDLAVITAYNGFGYRADDHGSSPATAASLALSGNQVSGSGIIETSTDSDWFQFTTAAGDVTLTISPAALGPNLDIEARLYDSAGTLLGTSNPSTTLQGSFNLSLPGGQYYLRLDGVGVGNPATNPPTGYTDYGSLGQYTITGTIVAPNSDSLSIAATDATKAEGQSGATAYTFTVTRSGDTSGTTTVTYAVAGSGTNPADGADFVGGVLPTGSLTFEPGVTSLPISIPVAGDTTVEPDNGFVVSLSNPSGLTQITQGSASGLIQNDDAAPTPPTVSISPASLIQAEGTGATATAFVFTLTRSGDTSGTGSVKYSVTGRTGKPANAADFVGGLAANVTVSFATGQTTASVVLNVVADSTKESNEGFRVTLSSAVGMTISTGTADGTINNDDGGGKTRAAQPLTEEEPVAVAIADPLWFFLPAEALTAEQRRQTSYEIVTGGDSPSAAAVAATAFAQLAAVRDDGMLLTRLAGTPWAAGPAIGPSAGCACGSGVWRPADRLTDAALLPVVAEPASGAKTAPAATERAHRDDSEAVDLFASAVDTLFADA